MKLKINIKNVKQNDVAEIFCNKCRNSELRIYVFFCKNMAVAHFLFPNSFKCNMGIFLQSKYVSHERRAVIEV